ncbi:riboflavin transporter FmnP [Elusimicrobium posterum]|uniref:hypothetical protein n=1 Tax=Elusimicrobium posterum TaxID=3116653 RepID=UPI003C75C2B4
MTYKKLKSELSGIPVLSASSLLFFIAALFVNGFGAVGFVVFGTGLIITGYLVNILKCLVFISAKLAKQDGENLEESVVPASVAETVNKNS